MLPRIFPHHDCGPGRRHKDQSGREGPLENTSPRRLYLSRVGSTTSWLDRVCVAMELNDIVCLSVACKRLVVELGRGRAEKG